MKTLQRMMGVVGLIVGITNWSTGCGEDGVLLVGGGSEGSAQGGGGQGGGGSGGNAQGGAGQGGSEQGGGGQGGGGDACNKEMPNASWSESFSAEGALYLGAPRIDAMGNVFLAGDFGTSLKIGGAAMTSNGSRNVFLAKLDNMGTPLWAQSFKGTGEQIHGNTVLDAAGNVIMKGSFYTSIDFGNGALSASGNTTFLAKFDGANGNVIWDKALPGVGAFMDADAAGNVILTGTFDKPINLGGGSLTPNGGADIFLAKFDPNGTLLWSKQCGVHNDLLWGSAVVDPAGNIVFVGSFIGSLDFGGNPLQGNTETVFMAKFDPNGTHLWSKALGSGIMMNRRVDSAGNIFVAAGGEYIDFGNGPLAGYNFVAKFDPQGNYLWSHDFGVLMADLITNLHVDDSGNVFAMGLLQSPVDLAGCPSLAPTSHVLWKFGADGQYLWTGHFAETVDVAAVGTSKTGEAVVTGAYLGSVDFGTGALMSTGNADVFAFKLAP